MLVLAARTNTVWAQPKGPSLRASAPNWRNKERKTSSGKAKREEEDEKQTNVSPNTKDEMLEIEHLPSKLMKDKTTLKDKINNKEYFETLARNLDFLISAQF